MRFTLCRCTFWSTAQDLRDGVDAVPSDLYQRGHVTTAGATPAELTAAYRQALQDSGGDGVVAVHISGALSSTLGAAEYAAGEFGGSVRVVDSKSTAMGTGFVALAAARGRAVRRPTSMSLPPRRNQRSTGSTASSSCTAWTICAAAAVSAPPPRGWGPRWRSSRCCASTSRVSWCLLAAGAHRIQGGGRDGRAGPGGGGGAARGAGRAPRRQPRRARPTSRRLCRRRYRGAARSSITDLGPVLGVHVGPGALGVVVALDG